MSDLDAYWENRKNNKRGQGEPFNPVVRMFMRPVWPTKPVSNKALRKNTKRARNVAERATGEPK